MEDKLYIACIGVDNKYHVCEPHSSITKCGIKVKTKKVEDIENRVSTPYIIFSCYECTY